MKESAFNRNWGAYGAPVRWSKFPAENPRAQWSERVLAAGPSAGLESWAKTDVPAGWLAYRVAQQTEDAPLLHRHDFSDPASRLPIELAPSSKNKADRLPSGLRLIAPTGKIGPVVVPVEYGKARLVRLQLWSWSDELGQPEAQSRVTLRFVGPGHRTETTVVCQPRQTIVPAVLPVWATALEYEIAFTGGAFIQEATVQLIDLPASSAR
jgi:hypothetical protein